MKKLALLLVVLFAFAINMNATEDDKNGVQTTTINGKVIDQTTGEALAGVQVKIQGTNLSAYTDFDGNFVIKDVAPGNYNITTSYISYQSNTLKDVDVTSFYGNTMKVEMKTISDN